ncbi:MAG: trypsin-like peptidase domain-containing protein [Roseobacter sp.]|nr:trypsin-like peptidase domain-containing protein [Roseobacter sp.]
MVRLIGAVFFAVFLTVIFRGSGVIAQEQPLVWVQIEAQPSLSKAQDRARDYGAALPNVNGFALGGGWYAIALGPYTADDAREVLRIYRREGQIPRDSYIADTANFRQQFWPIGAAFATGAAPLPDTADVALVAPVPPVTPQPAAPQSDLGQAAVASAPDETLAEARASEARLTQDAREGLQIALQWAGYYNSTIDGAFGRGTRSSMSAWQEANNHPSTGVLTTLQRSELLADYNAVLSDLDLRLLDDTTTGIALKMPLARVKFSKYNPPFAHFDSIGPDKARVLLISQEGDQSALFGLYDIMQTLEIVPETGPRERNDSSFTLIGEAADFISHTQVWLKDGSLKGFTLIWPSGEEERRQRLLDEMLTSFTRTEGVMDASAGTDDQSIDLVAGLEIRRPRLSRSGFFLDRSGHVVTTSEVVKSCDRITIENAIEADVIADDKLSGVAILRPKDALSPGEVAVLAASAPRLQTEIAVAGFSYEGVLGAPTLTFGMLSDVKGLGGEPQLRRLALTTLAGDAGGPVFDETGAVLGMLLPEAQGARQLPENVSFAIDADTIRKVARSAGLATGQAGRTNRIAPEDLTSEAQGVTVLVGCWD